MRPARFHPYGNGLRLGTPRGVGTLVLGLFFAATLAIAGCSETKPAPAGKAVTRAEGGSTPATSGAAGTETLPGPGAKPSGNGRTAEAGTTASDTTAAGTGATESDVPPTPLTGPDFPALPLTGPAIPGTTAAGSTSSAGEAEAAAPVHPSTRTEAPPADSPDSPAGPSAKLIPRDALFGNPQKAAARISPDGKYMSFLAPRNGVLNIFVAPRGQMDKAKPVTDDKKRGIMSYFWAYTSQHLLYTLDTDGDENWQLYRADAATGENTNLTPLPGVQVQVEAVSDRAPETILIGLNDRDKQFHDVYSLNIVTGERKLVQENPGVDGFLADEDYNIRLAMKYDDDASQVILAPDGKGGWKEFQRIASLDAMTTSPAGFDKTGTKLYMMDSRGRNTSALMVIDLATDKETEMASNPKADVGEVIVHPTEQNIQAVSFTYARREWKILDPAITDDLAYLATVEDGEFEVTSRALDDKFWTVAYIVDDGPVRFYLYDREAKKADYLFSSRDDLKDYQLVKMHPVLIPARDGLELVSYLSLPPGSDPDGNGRPDHPVPLVLNVHGGPWSRDGWGYDAEHQWLANRGYAVLSVNYRGSTGFGKEFVNAANGEWAGKMHDDLLDAVAWAVKEKIAPPDKIAIMGGSYGGYATLVGLTFTPEVFACGVDIVGPSSLVTLLQHVPPYWIPFMPVMKERVGDHTTDAGRKQLLERSPLTKADKIVRPLLIGQGAKDPRVNQSEADQIVAAMHEHKIPVTYVTFPDEGHGFERPANRMSFNAVVEAFLAKQLGGRYEPVGKDFVGSTLQVPTGAEDVPGLEAALKQHATAEKPSELPSPGEKTAEKPSEKPAENQ